METTWGPRWAARPTPSGSTRACPDTDQRLRQQLAEVFQSSLDGKGGGSSPAGPESDGSPRQAPRGVGSLPAIQVAGAESTAGPQPGWQGVFWAVLPGERRAPQGAPLGAPARSIPSCTVSICGQRRSLAEVLLGLRREPGGHSSVPVCSALVTPGLSLTLSCPCDISGF